MVAILPVTVVLEIQAKVVIVMDLATLDLYAVVAFARNLMTLVVVQMKILANNAVPGGYHAVTATLIRSAVRETSKVMVVRQVQNAVMEDALM